MRPVTLGIGNDWSSDSCNMPDKWFCRSSTRPSLNVLWKKKRTDHHCLHIGRIDSRVETATYFDTRRSDYFVRFDSVNRIWYVQYYLMIQHVNDNSPRVQFYPASTSECFLSEYLKLEDRSWYLIQTTTRIPISFTTSWLTLTVGWIS